MQKDIECLKEKIAGADKILLGIGEEFADKGFEDSEIYRCYKKLETGQEAEQWVLPYLKAYYLNTSDADEQLFKAYRSLENLLDGKDYFVITLQTDGRIFKSGLDKDRVTAPCGSYEQLQCTENCENSVMDAGEETERIAGAVLEGTELSAIEKPVCPGCASPLGMNVYPQEHYCEAGYIGQWQKYQQWLGNTLNRNTVFLEAGAGFALPGLIRWPFEKAVYLNQKAYLFRIHEKFGQLSEEVGEKGCSIQVNSVKFFADL